MARLTGNLASTAGVATCGAAVAIFPTSVCATQSTSVCSATATTTTNSSGIWDELALAANTYDVRITCGSSVRWRRYNDEVQHATFQTGDACASGTEGNFYWGDANDAAIRWSTADSSNHALVLALGQSNQVLHIAEACDIATDWNVSANAADSEVWIHSSTSPATDYLVLGRHTGTIATIDVQGGTTLNLDIAGNTELTVTSAGLNVPANSDLNFTGTTGTNDIVLTNALADALSITDGSADIVVIDTSTSGNVITLTSALTVGSDGSGSDVIFHSATGSDNLTWDASEELLTITGTDGQTALNVADGNVTIADNLTVSGNLTVTGTTTSVDSTTINAATAFVFEGATADAHETTFGIVDPTADATINLPAMSAGTYYLPVMGAASTTAIGSTPAELNLLDGSAKSTSSITICDADAFIVIDGTTTKQIPASDLTTYVGAGTMSSFQLEDDDGTEVAISNAKEVKIIGSGVTTNWTDTSTGSDGDPYDLTITVDAAQTGITSVYNTSLKAGRDADNLVDFATTDNKIILRVNGVNEVELVENALSPVTSDGVALGTSSLMWSDVFLACGGVVNFNNGDVVLTHSSNTLTMTGGALTVGVDDTGHDVKFFGAAAGAFMQWDESLNLVDLRGAPGAGPGHLKLTTGETTVVACDVLGRIDFQAPLEADCSADARLVAATIAAVAQDTFADTVNATDLIFYTGHSETAAERFRLTSQNEIGIAGANYGTDGQVLTSGGAGAAVAWEDAGGTTASTIISDTRTAAQGSGDESYACVGFQPTAIIIQTVLSGSNVASWGFADDALGERAIAHLNTPALENRATELVHLESGSDKMVAVLKTLDADGFTISWTKTNNGMLATFNVLCLG